MKIGMQTWGSVGDVRPLLALGDGLTKAGHEVTLVVTSLDNYNYQGICDQLKINYRQIPDHVDVDLKDFSDRVPLMNFFKWLQAVLDEMFFPYEQAMYEAAQALVAESDYVIGHHILYPLKLAAAKQGKPFVSVMYAPGNIPSTKHPPVIFPNLGRYLNPLWWKLIDAVCNRGYKAQLTRLWRAEGVKPPKNVLTELLTSQLLNLVAVDPVFCIGSDDWQPHNQVCGFLELTEDAQTWTFPESLQVFLDQNPPPIYMSFGTLQQTNPEWSMDLMLQAVEIAGCRAIVQTSSERYPPGSRTENVYFIGKHPHQPVFKQCAAIVHHGGAGTTHTAARSGRPSIVVPFINEQYGWGMRLKQLGVADEPLPAQSVAAQALADAITAVLGAAAYSDRAKEIGQSMQTTHGVDRAVEILQAKIHQQFKTYPQDKEKNHV